MYGAVDCICPSFVALTQSCVLYMPTMESSWWQRHAFMTFLSKVTPTHPLVKECHERVCCELLPMLCITWQLTATASIGSATTRVPISCCEIPATFKRYLSTAACSCLLQELHTAGAQLKEASHSASGAHLPLRSPPGRAL